METWRAERSQKGEGKKGDKTYIPISTNCAFKCVYISYKCVHVYIHMYASETVGLILSPWFINININILEWLSEILLTKDSCSKKCWNPQLFFLINPVTKCWTHYLVYFYLIIFFPTNSHTVKGNLAFILETRDLRFGNAKEFICGHEVTGRRMRAKIWTSAVWFPSLDSFCYSA